MNKPLVFLLLLLPLAFASNAQNWIWARGASGCSVSAATTSVTDASGNIYFAGTFSDSTVSFGTFTLTSISGSHLPDIFLVKYDPNGNVIWAKNFGGGTNQNESPLLTIDKSGNLYLTGIFSGIYVMFGSTVLVNTGGINRSEMFLVKLDTAGNTIWAKGVGGQDVMVVNGITVDNSGNIYVAGHFIGINSIVFGADTLVHTGNGAADQLFLVKYKGDGSVQFAKTCTGTNSGWSQGESITIARNGNFYFTGNFNGPSVIFGTDTLINTDSGYYDIFLVEYDSLGNLIWVKSYGGYDDEFGLSTNIDSSGNFYLYGEFNSFSLTLGSNTLAGGCCYNMFVAKCDSAGNVIWAKNVNHYVHALSAFCDSAGNFYLGGDHGGTDHVYFDLFTVPVGSTFPLHFGCYDIYVVKYNSIGNVEWAIGADSGGSKCMTSITHDFQGNIYVSGFFVTPTISLGATTLTNDSLLGNLFVAKLNTVIVHHSPHFQNGPLQSLTLCENAAPVSIDTSLAAIDSNIGTSVSWSTVMTATHGVLTATYSTLSGGGRLIPAGLTYTPLVGYAGVDSFRISVSDGATSDTTAIYVTIDSIPLVSSIGGFSNVCVGSTISLTDATPGGTWSSSNTLNASIDSVGTVSGLAVGYTVITYVLAAGCGPDFVVDTIHIYQIPAAGTISGADSICVGAITTLTDSITGGTWATYNTCASISGGIVLGLLPGVDTISYTVTNMCGSNTTLKVVTVNAAPEVDSISGSSDVTVGFGITLIDSTTGGVWFSCDTSIAIVDSGGNLLAIALGTCTIGYAVTNSCGSDTAKTIILVSPVPYMPVTAVINYPNPSKGSFTLKILSDFNETAKVNILNIMGGFVKSFETLTNKNSSISIDGDGIFFLHVLSAHVSRVSKVIIEK